MPSPPASPRWTSWLRTLLVVLGLNGLFLALVLLASALPPERLAERALAGFESGSLSTQDRRRFDSEIGWHQYNDCLILQMISNEDRVLANSLGPVVYYPEDFRGFCRAFRGLLTGEVARDELYSFRYTRYWHGHNALAAALLYGLDLATVRHLLRAAAYLSLIVLGLVALRAVPELRILGMVFAFFGALFWGLPYFAQSPSHGPGDTTIVLGFVILLAAARRGLSTASYQALCAGFGAVLVFMEFLTGLLPTAAALLLPFGYLAARPAGPPAGHVAQRWRFAVTGLAAFSLGVVLTALLKQLLALAAFGPEVIDAFTNNLNYYLQDLDSGPRNRILMGFYAAAASVVRFGQILSYGSLPGAVLLFGSSLAAWIGAMVLARRSASKDAVHCLAACAAGASLILVWMLVLPTHTFYHPYMVRMMIAPIALGWVALALQLPGLRGERYPAARADETGELP